MGVPPEFWLSTLMLYWPAVPGLVMVPVGMMKPYREVLLRLAEVRPETTIVRGPAVDAAVRVPGGTVMLPGVFGKPVVDTEGVPVAIVKPAGKVILILDTEVGVVFSLKVTNMSLPVVALIPRRPRLTLVWLSCVAPAIDGSMRLIIRAIATNINRVFFSVNGCLSIIFLFFVYG